MQNTFLNNKMYFTANLLCIFVHIMSWGQKWHPFGGMAQITIPLPDQYILSSPCLKVCVDVSLPFSPHLLLSHS